jgi:hypothetical protein
MLRLGFWIVLGAVACLALTFLPAILGNARDFEFMADALLCDGNQAVLSVNLSEDALSKGNLGSVVSGYCANSATGQRIGPIPVSRLADRLAMMLFAAMFGVLLMGIGLFRRKGQQSISVAAAPTTAPSSKSAAQVRQRDAEDRAARSEADYRRAHAPVAAAKPASAAAAIPDWMAGMPAASLSPAPAAQPPSQPFDFSDTPAAKPPPDLEIQLNLLQLAYESSLIMRSEYDARRAALLAGRRVSRQG